MEDSLLVQALAIIRETGYLGILILVLVGGWRRWWVYGWVLESMLEQQQRRRSAPWNGEERRVGERRRNDGPRTDATQLGQE